MIAAALIGGALYYDKGASPARIAAYGAGAGAVAAGAVVASGKPTGFATCSLVGILATALVLGAVFAGVSAKLLDKSMLDGRITPTQRTLLVALSVAVSQYVQLYAVFPVTNAVCRIAK